MSFCPKCGYQNSDQAIYCGRCGSSLTGQGYAQPGGPTVVVVGNSVQQAPVGSNSGMVWLWVNIAFTVLGCCTNPLFWVGIIFGGISVSKYKNGLYAEAKSSANVAKWLFWIALILGVIVTVISAVLGLIPVIIAFIATIAESSGLY